MKKEERQNINYFNLKSNAKKTNIYMKNLLEEVEEENLKKLFEECGVVTSVCVKSPEYTPPHITQKTKYGFINYQ